jgi:hypothetical protein
MNEDKETNWTEVAAKCLCFMSLQQSDAKNGTMLERANFLAGLGLSRADCAAILGTSSDSLGALKRRSRKKKAAKHAKKR